MIPANPYARNWARMPYGFTTRSVHEVHEVPDLTSPLSTRAPFSDSGREVEQDYKQDVKPRTSRTSRTSSNPQPSGGSRLLPGRDFSLRARVQHEKPPCYELIDSALRQAQGSHSPIAAHSQSLCNVGSYAATFALLIIPVLISAAFRGAS